MKRALLLALAVLALPLPALADAPVWGLASQYDPGVMPRVVANRVAWGQLEPGAASVYLAGPDCGAIGARLWIRPRNWPGGDETAWQGWERAVIADCPGDQQAADFLASLGVPYEVDGETVARWGYPRGRGIPIQVAWGWPADLELEEVE